MHSEYIQIIEELSSEDLPVLRNDFGVPLNAWFTDAGITPDGRCWVAPSDEFYEQWLLNDALKDRLNELGFDWGFDGAELGSWCEFVFYCPFGNREVRSGKDII